MKHWTLVFSIHFIFIVTILLYTTCRNYGNSLNPLLLDLTPEDQKIVKEAMLDAVDLIELYGYRAESHRVVVGDGYAVTIHRIPSSKPNAVPVYLQHGAMISSKCWVDNGNESFGFLLANEGYDIWLGNLRDTIYGQRLKNTPTEERYGAERASFYEVPAIIDYILSIAGVDKIPIIGHSLGGTVTTVALTLDESLNNKVSGIIALAPGASLRYSPSVLLRLSKFLHSHFRILYDYVTKRSKYPSNYLQKLMPTFCLGRASEMCKILLGYSQGYNPNSYNAIRTPIFVTSVVEGYPGGYLYHFFQTMKSYKFYGYDYGAIKNLEIYGQRERIEFDLNKVKVPVALFYAANDVVVNPIDIQIFSRQLPNLLHKELLEDPMTAHHDMIWLKSKEIVKKILPILSKFSENIRYTTKDIEM